MQILMRNKTVSVTEFLKRTIIMYNIINQLLGEEYYLPEQHIVTVVVSDASLNPIDTPCSRSSRTV